MAIVIVIKLLIPDLVAISLKYIFLPAIVVCVEQSNKSEFERKLTFTNQTKAQSLSLTNTKPLLYVTITIITLGCPFNPVNDF